MKTLNTKSEQGSGVLAPQTPSVPKEKKKQIAPRYIKVTITEEDRQKADRYCSNGGCLIATALKREGYELGPGGVGGFEVNVNGKNYTFDEECGVGGNVVKTDYSSREKPFYLPSVVGKVVSCTRVD